jgi:hypothetical protein
MFKTKAEAQAKADKLNKTARNKWAVGKWIRTNEYYLYRSQEIKGGCRRNYFLG